MSILHLCNTDFEWELAGEKSPQNPLFDQLSKLPRLWAKQGDALLLPGEKVDLNISRRLDVWGHSLRAKKWAQDHNVSYDMPPWDTVKHVNSKLYSHKKSPLPGARLLHRGDRPKGRELLKSCFGTAGQGHMLASQKKALAFCQRQWDIGLPVLAEPCLSIDWEFSTHWHISPEKEITHLGWALCKASPKGVHLSNTVGQKAPDQSLIETQMKTVESTLKEMATLGYFGPVGIDALVYDGGKLQPISEINARKTMGWVALKVAQKRECPIKLAFRPDPTKRQLKIIQKGDTLWQD